jgi:signal peptidase I
MKKKIFKDWILPAAVAVILALLIRQFVFFNILVPTGSMIPTININDRLLVTKIYNTNKLKRGEIVVFKSKELNETLIKRLIGLPGDVVEVKDDGVYVNNAKLNEPYVVNSGGKTGKYTVPEGKYFFLGDNRPISRDSRWWNDPYISASDIMGVARLVYYPLKDVKIY